MSTALNMAIKLLDHDTRYVIRYGSLPDGEYQATGYVDVDDIGTLYVYATNASANYTLIPRAFVQTISLARKPHTQLYPKAGTSCE